MDTLVTQSDCNGEDSSGSDGASLLSVSIPAKETDRFGFLLGSGSTVGTDGPPPEVVRQREAKWLSIISQWDRILSKKTNKVKDQCRKGIPASLRARCWPLLCRATERMNRNEHLYKTLDSSPALQSWVDVIERDIDRQFPFHEMFLSRDCHGQRGLFRVLKAYTQFRPDEGYCQGQGPVAAVLLMNMPAEEAFWCLVQISEQYLPGYYSPLLEGVLFDAGVLNGVLRKACPAAYKHLKKHGVEPLMFSTDWLMCLYTRHLPFNTLLRVWDLFFCYGVRVLFQVAVVLVRRSLGKQEQRDECEGQMETLERLRGVKDRISEEDDAFIEEVCSVSLSRRDLEKEMEKEMERWKKERPASTFNPWGRCHGYQAAWIKGRETEEEHKRKERELGNLSVPLGRSPSSLSPSFLRKKWRRGSTMNEKEGNGDITEVEMLEKTCVQRNEDGCLNNNRDQETSDFSVHRKPPQSTYEGLELNQNRAGHESDPVNAESCSETFEPQSSTADVSGPTPRHGAAPSQGEVGAGHTSQPEDVASEAATRLHTPDDPTLASAVVDEEKQSAVDDTAPSEEQRKLPDSQSDNHSQTVHVDSTPSQEHCRSEVCKTDSSFLTGQTNLHGDIEEQGGGPPGQHAEHGERGDRQDVCVQNVISENGTGRASTKQSGLKEEDQLLSEERVCLVEGIDELRAKINASAEPPASEHTQNRQTSQVIQESQTASISINEELSEQMHSDHFSENVRQTSSDSSDCATPLAVERLVGDTAEQPAASATQQEGELPDHVTNSDVLAREPISNEASQEGLVECNPAVADTLGEYPGRKPEMNVVSGQCEDTTEDPRLSAKVPTIQNGQVSVEDTTGVDMEKQEPQTSLQLALHADTSSTQVQSKEGLPTPEGGAAQRPEGGAAPTPEGGAAPTPEGGAAPTSEGGAAPTSEGGAAPTAEGGAAPTPEGGAAPRPEGGTAQRPEGGAAPTPEGGAAPTPEGGAAPTPEGGAEEHEQFIPSTDKNLQEMAEQEPNRACSESKQLQSQPVCSDQEYLRKESASTCEEEVDTSDVRLPNEDNMPVMELGRPAHRTMAQTAEGETPAETVGTNPAKEPVEQGLTAELQPVTLTPECDKCETPREGAESRPCDSPDPQGPEQHRETTDKRRARERQEDVLREDSNDVRPSSVMSITDTNSTEVLSTAVTEGEPRQTPAPSMAAKVVPEQLPEFNMGESLDRPLPTDCQRSASTGDYKALRTCSSRMPDPRKLCEDTFKDLQGSDSKDSPATTSSMGQDAGKGHDPAQHAPEHPESPRRFGLFRRLRGDHSKDGPEGGAKGKANTPKMTVPTILIQDFSEQVAEPEAGLTSKERRKRRREQERRKKEEEKARKKREKELEKEKVKERRKPQTRGKSFQVHSSTKADSVVPPTGNSSSNTLGSKRNSAPFFDTYF